jgi:hypothetical protein
VRETLVEVLDHPRHTEGHEVNVSPAGIPRPEIPIPVLHLVDESPFDAVDVLARTIVGDG